MNQGSAVSEIPLQIDAPPVQVLRELRLRDFRNFREADLRFPARGTLIVGENGSGKTNLLEAIYYLEVFRSLRGARDEQLVGFGADGFHLRGRFEKPETGETREVSVGYDARSRKKRVLVDGLEVDRLGDAIGHAAVVVFSPADVALVSGGPGERRRFLDIVLCLNRRGYMDALQRFRQALRQRNSLLRQNAAQDVIEAYEPGLVEPAAVVMAERASWIEASADLFARRTEQVGERPARIRYQPGVRMEDEAGAAPDRHQLADAMRDALRRNALRERERGMTLAGPHRDDFELMLDSGDGPLDLREFGSGGQQRTAAVALRMIEAETIRSSRRVEPMILLDDVFAEFDARRSARILELVAEADDAQAVFTAPSSRTCTAAPRRWSAGASPPAWWLRERQRPEEARRVHAEAARRCTRVVPEALRPRRKGRAGRRSHGVGGAGRRGYRQRHASHPRERRRAPRRRALEPMAHGAPHDGAPDIETAECPGGTRKNRLHPLRNGWLRILNR